jgi:hypothetical protein
MTRRTRLLAVATAYATSRLCTPICGPRIRRVLLVRGHVIQHVDQGVESAELLARFETRTLTRIRDRARINRVDEVEELRPGFAKRWLKPGYRNELELDRQLGAIGREVIDPGNHGVKALVRSYGSGNLGILERMMNEPIATIYGVTNALVQVSWEVEVSKLLERLTGGTGVRP